MAQSSAVNSCWSLKITEYQIEFGTKLSRKLVGCNEAAADEAVAVLEARGGQGSWLTVE